MVTAVLELIFAVFLLIGNIVLFIGAWICIWHSFKVEDKQDKTIDLLYAVLCLLPTLTIGGV